MALPGTPGGQYTADGLEHTPRGTPSSRVEDHADQLDKRQAKVTGFDYGNHWAAIEGSGEMAIVTWGSVTGAAREAVERARARGIDARLVAPRLLAPVRPAEMAAALAGAKRILTVEQSHGGQFHHYLRAFYDLPGDVRAHYRPGPLPITADEIVARLETWS
jgi:2-oxoglutarate ferredoxin oxidoreductase subunit alpha